MNIFEKLYQELKEKYGTAGDQWALWCKSPKTKKEKEEVIIAAILTQRTNWKNVEMALDNLKQARACSLKRILQLDQKKLALLIKPVGFYQAKTVYLFHLAKFILENYGSLARMEKSDLKELREWLLELKGIGPETADSILLYALDKPVFVIDEYTRRLVKERNLSQNLSYGYLQKLFEENLKKNFRLYQDFHALIVIQGKNEKSKI